MDYVVLEYCSPELHPSIGLQYWILSKVFAKTVKESVDPFDNDKQNSALWKSNLCICLLLVYLYNCVFIYFF